MHDLDFGQALAVVKAGGLVKRAGWLGLSAVSLFSGSLPPERLATDERQLVDGIPAELFSLADTGTVTRHPFLLLRTPLGANMAGWVPSASDLLAADWQAIDPEVLHG